MFNLAVKNVFRRKNQVFVAILVTVIATMVFTVLFNIYNESKTSIKLNQDRMGADLVIYPENAENSPQNLLYSGVSEMKYIEEAPLMDRIPLDEVESITNQFFVKTLPGASCCDTGSTYRIVGIDSSTDFLIKPWLKEENIEKLNENSMILGKNVSSEFGRKAFLLNTVFDIEGELYKTGSAFDESLFVDIETARKLGKNTFSSDYFDEKDSNKLITTSFIKLKDGVDVKDFASKLDIEDLGAKSVYVSDVRANLESKLNNLLSLFLIFAILVFVSSSIAISTLYNLIAKERKAEIGYLRSIGLSKKDIMKESLLEVIIQAGLAGLIGALAGGLVSYLVTGQIKEMMSISLGYDTKSLVLSMLISIVFALVISLLATIRPIVKNAKLDPSQAITGGI